MKIRMTFDYDERTRRAIAHHFGWDAQGKKFASRQDIINWIEMLVDSTNTDVVFEYEHAMACEREEAARVEPR